MRPKLRTIVLLFIFFIGSGTAFAKEYQQGRLLKIKEGRYEWSYYTYENVPPLSPPLKIDESRPFFHMIVKAGDLIYVAEYQPFWSFKTRPLFIEGDPIEFRINKSKIYFKKEDGKELKARIVRRIRQPQPDPRSTAPVGPESLPHHDD